MKSIRSSHLYKFNHYTFCPNVLCINTKIPNPQVSCHISEVKKRTFFPFLEWIRNKVITLPKKQDTVKFSLKHIPVNSAFCLIVYLFITELDISIFIIKET